MVCLEMGKIDADFIIHCRNHLSELLDYVEELEAKLSWEQKRSYNARATLNDLLEKSHPTPPEEK